MRGLTLPAGHGFPRTLPAELERKPSALEAVYARNLNLLLQAAGDRLRLAAALELAPGRVEELARGVAPLSPELASHIEESLQLPPRWMDEPHQGELQKAIPTATLCLLRGKRGAQEVKMAARTAEDSTVRLEERRRKNFALITGAKGAKRVVADLLELSPSSITFLANGEKRFSDVVARTLEKKLGLESGWLDRRQSFDTVPAHVWQKLGNPETNPANSQVGPVKPLPANLPPLMTRDELLRRLDAGMFSTATVEPQPTNAATVPAAPARVTPVAAPEAPKESSKTTAPAAGAQPVARALMETIEKMSANGQLSEAQALKMLGELLRG